MSGVLTGERGRIRNIINIYSTIHKKIEIEVTQLILCYLFVIYVSVFLKYTLGV